MRCEVGAMLRRILFFVAGSLALAHQAAAQPARVVDIPTRPDVTQRFVVMTPENPKASMILFAGGHGGLQISPSGKLKWGANNFVVRTQGLFARNGLTAVVVDAPSDRQSPPYLGAFRQTPEHVADIKAVISWLKQQATIPVWLVGTSRGTQSAAHIAVAPDRRRGRARWTGAHFDDSRRPQEPSRAQHQSLQTHASDTGGAPQAGCLSSFDV